MWTLLLIPAVLAGMSALLWLTDALDSGLTRRRVRTSVVVTATPEEAEAVVSRHSDALLRRAGG